MKSPISWISVLALLALGCAGALAPPRAAGDVEEMKARILELQKRAAVTDVEVARLRQQVAELEGLLRERRQGGAAATGESSAMAPTPPEALPVATADVEESDLELAEEPAGSSSVASPAPPAPGGPPPGAGRSVGYRPLPPEAQSLYDDGYTLFHRGRYVDAESTFQRFLQTYPDTELSDNAQYWIGESRYARGDLQGALAAFRETLQRYPDGNKVPDALIKVAVCLEGLGDREGAREHYDEVIRRFPGTAASAMAEERRAALDS